MPDHLTVRVLPENEEVVVRRGAAVLDCLGAEADGRDAIVAARLNNEIVSLMDQLSVDGFLTRVYLTESSGSRIYRNSLVFLFETAARTLYPDRRMVIGISLGHSFFHRFRDGGPVSSAAEADAIEHRMRELADADIPILPDELSWTDAVELFEKRADSGAAKLIRGLNESRTKVWRCGDYLSMRHGPLVPSTGILKTFSVERYKEGFLLRFPPSKSPGRLEARDDEPKMYAVYQEHKRWGEILGVPNVGSLSALSRSRAEAREFIQTSEALHDRKIAELAGIAASKHREVGAVMIAGPSSSGKTTFTKKLALSLKSNGLQPLLISLDDYYRNRNEIPRDGDGKLDFEALEALDLDLLKKNIEELLAGQETEIPIFDFKKLGGRLPKGRNIRLEENSILLFEGIHGLNPHLTPGMARDAVFRIYVSALTQLNIDDHARISTTDNRLVRRIVRDHQFRQCAAVDTLKIWPSVRRGEKRHIFPWQGSADQMFNSALDYELAILKVFAEPLLRTVSPNQEEYGEARRLLAELRNFSPFPVEEVPELSIIREFIGRSGFHY